ncbi:permease [Hydrogenovibrio kuenenii]|uniref:permease n=1 Tax=Hydrogenovibrio kuenenii TaxID=63658 RepID=UPI0004638AF8|nr:permease [Hydrogenovibrio kuenenii]
MFDQIANFFVYQVLSMTEHTQAADSLHFFVMDLLKIFFMLVVIIYVIGLFRAFVSTEWIRDKVQGRAKWVARSLAITLGSVTPFCSCSSVPLFVGFVEARIPMGITFAFLIASPMINEVAVVLLWSILGWKVTLLYVAAGLVVAYIGSIVLEWFKPERWVESYVWELKSHGSAKGAMNEKMTWTQRHQFAREEVKTIVNRIWKWIVVGVGLGALFHGYVPQEWVTTYLSGSSNWWSVPAAVLLGVPLYSNATGVVPIVEAMLNKGVPIGTSLALMMSIAALSLPELLILRKVIRWPALAAFVGVLSVAFILVGYLFNFLFA